MPKTDQIKIVFSETSDISIIPQMKITNAFKYLYIKYTLIGSQQLQLLYTTSHAINGARLIFASPFTRQQLKLYPFKPQTHILIIMRIIFRVAIPTAILVLWYNHHCPLVLRYEKHPYGGSN